jgi:hypothetical protein
MVKLIIHAAISHLAVVAVAAVAAVAQLAAVTHVANALDKNVDGTGIFGPNLLSGSKTSPVASSTVIAPILPIQERMKIKNTKTVV